MMKARKAPDFMPENRVKLSRAPHDLSWGFQVARTQTEQILVLTSSSPGLDCPKSTYILCKRLRRFDPCQAPCAHVAPRLASWPDHRRPSFSGTSWSGLLTSITRGLHANNSVKDAWLFACLSVSLLFGSSSSRSLFGPLSLSHSHLLASFFPAASRYTTHTVCVPRIGASL